MSIVGNKKPPLNFLNVAKISESLSTVDIKPSFLVTIGLLQNKTAFVTVRVVKNLNAATIVIFSAMAMRLLNVNVKAVNNVLSFERL